MILKHFGLSLHIYNCAKNGYNWLWKSIPSSHAVCAFLQTRCQYFCVSLHVGWNSSYIQTCFWFHWKPTCLLSVVLLTNSSDSFLTKWDLWSICAIGIHAIFIRWNRVCFIKKKKRKKIESSGHSTELMIYVSLDVLSHGLYWSWCLGKVQP